MAPASPNRRQLVLRLLPVVLLGAQACTPMGVPAQSPTQDVVQATAVVAAKPTLAPSPGYPVPGDSSPIAATPLPTEAPLPSETPFPTAVVEKGGQDVVIPGGNLVVSLPEGWYATSLPNDMFVRNYVEEGGGEFAVGDKRISIHINVVTVPYGKDTAGVIQDSYDREIASAKDNGVDAASISAPEPSIFGELHGHSYRGSTSVGFFVAYLADDKGNSLWVQITPTSSPAFDEALKIVETLRFK